MNTHGTLENYRKWLLANPDSVNDVFANGYTRLAIAVEDGHYEIVECIYSIDNNAVSTWNRDKQTPMHLAALKNNTTMIRLLHQTNPNLIYTFDDNGETPLHNTAARGHVDSIELLCWLGSDVDALCTTGYDMRPIDIAAVNERPESVIELLRLGSSGLDGSFTRWIRPVLAGNHVYISHIKYALVGEALHDLIPSEEEILHIRYQIYFSHSLLYRLLSAYSGFQTVNKFKKFKTSSRPAETLLPLYTAPSPEQRG